MTTAPSIAPASAADVNKIHSLAREIWYLYYPGIITVEQIDFMLDTLYADSELRSSVADPKNYWIKALSQNEIVGFGHLIGYLDKKQVKLDKLYVHPKIQSSGYGRAIIDHAGARYAKLGYESIYLQVNKGNLASIAFYKRVGFSKQKSVVIFDDYC